MLSVSLNIAYWCSSLWRYRCYVCEWRHTSLYSYLFMCASPPPPSNLSISCLSLPHTLSLFMFLTCSLLRAHTHQDCQSRWRPQPHAKSSHHWKPGYRIEGLDLHRLARLQLGLLCEHSVPSALSWPIIYPTGRTQIRRAGFGNETANQGTTKLNQMDYNTKKKHDKGKERARERERETWQLSAAATRVRR